MLGSFIQMEIQIVFRSLTVSAVKFTLAKMLGSFSEIEKQVVCTSSLPKWLYYVFLNLEQPIVFLAGKSYNN